MRLSQPGPVLGRFLLAVAVGVAAMLPGSVAGASPGRGDQPDERPGRVVLVTVPRLTWDDVVEADLENLKGFFAESAIGNLSLRTVGSRTSLGEGYLSLGTGNRALAGDSAAGLALAPVESFEDGTARTAYRRRMGLSPESEVLQLATPSIRRSNRSLLYGAVPGELGSTLQDNGWTPGVIGNADTDARGVPAAESSMGPSPDAPTEGSSDSEVSDDEGTPDAGAATEEPEEDPPVPDAPTDAAQDEGEQVASEPLGNENRPAALAMMNADGVVTEGAVTRRMLKRDQDYPYGLRLYGDRVIEEFTEMAQDRSAVLVELSDLERADRYASVVTTDQAVQFRDQALRRSDRLLGRLLDETRPSDLVVLVSPAAPRSGEVPTPIAIRGPGFGSGLLISGATRREGYVTISDIAPGILDQIGIESPDSMRGAPISVRARGDTSTGRYESFVDDNEVTTFRDETTGTITVVFVATLVIGLALTALAIARPDLKLARPVSFLALVIIAFPAVTFLAGLVRYDELGLTLYLLVALAVAATLAALAQVVGRVVDRGDGQRRTLVPPLLLVTLTYGVLLVDILSGGQLQINTTFGYSPVVAGRFAGFGNSAYSLFAISSVVVATGLWGLTRRRAATGGSATGAGEPGGVPTRADSSPPEPDPSEPHRARPRPGPSWVLGAVVAIFVATVVADGYPSFGSDVGGVLSIIPSAAVVVLLLSGRRISVSRLAIVAIATVVVLGTFAAVDLARPVEDQTHLGRLASDLLGSEGGQGLGTVIERKISANVGLLRRSTFTWTIPAALGFLIYLTRRRAGLLGELMDRVPGTRSCLWGGITMCALGFAVNDSGVAVPAIMFAILLPYLGYLLLALRPRTA